MIWNLMHVLSVSWRSRRRRSRLGTTLGPKVLLRMLPSKLATMVDTSSGGLAVCSNLWLCLIVWGAQSG
jgi:hypothetical protein